MAVHRSPPPSDSHTNPYANYVPHDLAYNADFEDSLIPLVLTDEPPPQTGIVVLPDDDEGAESQAPANLETAKLSSIDPHTLPRIPEADLPLPLNDPRRVYTSPIPGILLTHPQGYLEGGPPLDPEMDTFPEHFLSENASKIKTSADLHAAVQRQVAESLEQLKGRMQARKEAKERNEGLERELRALGEEHEMEVRVHRRMVEEQARKREARERRKKERD